MFGKRKNRGLALVLALAVSGIALLRELDYKKVRSHITKTQISSGAKSFTETFKENKKFVAETKIGKNVGLLIVKMIGIGNEIDALEKELISSKYLSKVSYNLSMDLTQMNSEEAEDMVVSNRKTEYGLIKARRQNFNDFLRENSEIIRKLRIEKKLFHIPEELYVSTDIMNTKYGIEELDKAKEKFGILINKLTKLEHETENLIKESKDAGFPAVKLTEFLQKLDLMKQQLSERISICEILIGGIKERLVGLDGLLHEVDIDGSYREKMPDDVKHGTRLLLKNNRDVSKYWGEDPY